MKTPRSTSFRGKTGPPDVVLLTGPINSGKTTALERWCRARAEADEPVDGILAPKRDGLRFLLEFRGERYRLDARRFSAEDRLQAGDHGFQPRHPGEETPPGNRAAAGGGLVRIGPHAFREEAFVQARDYLVHAYASLPPGGVLVIDEIGPLELRGEGLEPAVSCILAQSGGGDDRKKPDSPPTAPRAAILLVVREALVKGVCSYYGLNPRVVTAAQLAEL